MNKFTVLTLLIFIFAFWIFWLPGNRVANDYHLPHEVPIIEQILPWIFRETNVADGLGEYTGVTLWSQPLNSFFSILSVLSISPSLQTKFLGSLVFIIGFFSLSKLLQSLGVKGIGEYLGILFYLTNSYFILLFDGGQMSLALSYAISPLIVYLFLKMAQDHKFKYKFYLALAALCISILDIRFIYLLALILFFNSIFQLVFGPSANRLKFMKELLLCGVLVTVVLIGFHAYWILPSVLIKSPQLPQTYERAAQVDFLSFSSVGHSLLLQQPHWYKNIFGQISNLKAEFIFIPILVLLAPILLRRDKVVGFWLIIAALGIFLSKGSQPPYGQIYSWLFTHIPLFSLFRDPTKFYLFISLSYSILIAITIQEIHLRKNKYFAYLVLIYLVWLIRPIYLGEMTGLLSRPTFEQEYSKLEDYLKGDNNYSRIFWIPTKAPLGYAGSIHPPVEAARLVQKRPFAAGVKGTYETFNFLREAPYMGELFDVAGIGYIAYPYLNPKRDNLHPDNIKYYYLFLDQLSKRPWLSKVEDSPIPLFKVSEYQDKFFITPNIWWVVGSDSILNEATKSAELKLSKNALIFAEEHAGLSNRIDELPQAKIVLNNKTNLDLAGSFINLSNLIFPAKNLDFEPNKSGWWKREAADLINWRDFLHTKYGIDNQDFDLGGGWAVSEGSLKLKIHNKNFIKDKVLLARVLESTKSGQLSFYQGEKIIGKINTKKEGNNIRWFEVGKLMSNEDLTISSEGGINVINALSVLDIEQWQSYQSKIIEYKRNNRIVNFDDKHTKISSVIIEYEQVNPTKYLVTIGNLSEPSLLIFSQNYDSLWNLNDKSSLPVYSLLNGFKIDKDGQYTVEFKAQKFVYPGLIISGLTLGALVLFLFKSSKRW